MRLIRGKSTVVQRFAAKVQLPSDPGDCWEWQGKPNQDGYGRFKPSNRLVMAHRFSYELFMGKVPAGLECDHVCRNRRCVNPDHLRAVTHLENMQNADFSGTVAVKLDRTHCKHGHAYDDDNIYRHPETGARDCRKCRAESGKALRERRRRARSARLAGKRCECGAAAQMAMSDGGFTCRRCHLLKRVRPLRYA